MSVEKGQVWRDVSTGELIEVTKVKPLSALARYKNVSGIEHCVGEDLIEKYYELVTMDNIKKGEWVECIRQNKYVDGLLIEKGRKFKFILSGGGMIKIESVSTWVYEEYFEPCLPPQEEVMKKPKTYSIVEIANKIQGDVFVKGDKISDGPKKLPAEYDGFAFKWPSGTNVSFRKDSQWTIEYIDRWEEVDVKEAVKHLIDGGTLKVTHENGTSINLIENEKDWYTYVCVPHIAVGKWYKKINRSVV